MTERQLLDTVRDYYSQQSQVGEVRCRLNDQDLTPEQNAIFQQLSEHIKERYYGTGISIPEDLEGKRVLDLGCGTGSLVFILSKLVGPTGYVVGVDMAPGLLDTAKSQSEFHYKQWGYDKPNFEFRLSYAEKLIEDGFAPNSFDIIMSNGVFCLIPDKNTVFKNVYTLLKEGGQFFLSDVYADKDRPERLMDNETLWICGTTGSMRWDQVSTMAKSIGFTIPYLLCASPCEIKEEYLQMLDNTRYCCAGWRLFKLSEGAQQAAACVIYKGTIKDLPEAFPWDIDMTFQKGVGVNVDGELATILSTCYLSHHFSLTQTSGSPVINRNQNPFVQLDKLKAEGKLPENIFTID